MPFVEKGFQNILNKVIENRNFSATTEIENISGSEVLIVVIGTEVDEHANLANFLTNNIQFITIKFFG